MDSISSGKIPDDKEQYLLSLIPQDGSWKSEADIRKEAKGIVRGGSFPRTLDQLERLGLVERKLDDRRYRVYYRRSQADRAIETDTESIRWFLEKAVDIMGAITKCTPETEAQKEVLNAFRAYADEHIRFVIWAIDEAIRREVWSMSLVSTISRYEGKSISISDQKAALGLKIQPYLEILTNLHQMYSNEITEELYRKSKADKMKELDEIERNLVEKGSTAEERRKKTKHEEIRKQLRGRVQTLAK